MKKIIVLGGGAIGSILAALLSKKYNVTLVGRKDHVGIINNHGLQISGQINEKFHLKATTTIKDIAQQATILLTVKAHETKDAILGIKDKLRKDTVIVCIQNGLGSKEIIRKLTDCKIIEATTFISSNFLEPGKVEVTSLGKTVIPEEEKEIIKIFMETSIPLQTTSNINAEIWKKLTVNCVINGLGSILQVKNNMLQSAYLKDTKEAIIKECIAVAEKEGIILQKSLFESIDTFIQSSTNINSTLQDLRKHKSTEIDFLNGAIVKIGEKHNISTPVNRTIWNLIKTSESL